MSKEDGTLWEIPRRPDTEWLFESDVDKEEEVQKNSTEKRNINEK